MERRPSDTQIGAGSGKLLATIPFERLRQLNLNDSGIQGPDIQALAESPHLKRLEFLDIGSNNKVQGKHLAGLKRLPRCREVQMMFLR